MSLLTVVARPVDTQLVVMTRRTETVEGGVREMTVIVIGMQCVAIEIMAETGNGNVIETAGTIDEARVENDTVSLRQGEMIHLLCRRGGVVEEGKVGLTYHLLHLPHHRQCMGRMRDGDQALDLGLERDLHKDHVGEAIAGIMIAERIQVTVAVVGVEMMICHRGSTHEAKKAFRMPEEEVRGSQARARGLGEDSDHISG
jgi:hypothetical protein